MAARLRAAGGLTRHTRTMQSVSLLAARRSELLFQATYCTKAKSEGIYALPRKVHCTRAGGRKSDERKEGPEKGFAMRS